MTRKRLWYEPCTGPIVVVVFVFVVVVFFLLLLFVVLLIFFIEITLWFSFLGETAREESGQNDQRQLLSQIQATQPGQVAIGSDAQPNAHDPSHTTAGHPAAGH
jgi:hypothetical protein